MNVVHVKGGGFAVPNDLAGSAGVSNAHCGHVSLDTTTIYAETDLEMKASALATCEVAGEPKTKKRWPEDPELMTFLRSL